MYDGYRADFKQVMHIEAPRARRYAAERKAVLIDVRPPAEREVSMIPGAVSVEEFERDLSQYSNKVLIAYCTLGARSGRYADDKRREGIEIFNLRGSILAWIHAGGTLTNRDGVTTNVHVYGSKWNLAPGGYKAVW